MFADRATALRVERAESVSMRDMASALVGSPRAPQAFVREIGAGVATYARPGSPFNKLIGVGIAGPIDEAILGAIERDFRSRGEPLRAEITTLAAPETYDQLVMRGYRLRGFENVLARPLDAPARAGDAAIGIDRVTDATLPAFRETVVEATSVPDDTGAVIDRLSRDVIATVIADFVLAPGFIRYLARRDGALAGGASMRVQDSFAMLTGSATLPAHRRRGVQTALLARRLDDARAAGAGLAIITTAPGTQSQANVMKHGFSLLYARAILELG